MRYGSHSEITKRLRRANGHLRTIINMIEAGDHCLEISQQLEAVEKAILSAKKALIHDHIEHTFEQSLTASKPKMRAALREFRAITKYL